MFPHNNGGETGEEAGNRCDEFAEGGSSGNGNDNVDNDFHRNGENLEIVDDPEDLNFLDHSCRFWI